MSPVIDASDGFAGIVSEATDELILEILTTDQGSHSTSEILTDTLKEHTPMEHRLNSEWDLSDTLSSTISGVGIIHWLGVSSARYILARSISIWSRDIVVEDFI